MDIRDMEDKSLKIKWLKDAELEVCVGLHPKDDEPIFEKEIVHRDEEDEVDIFGINEENQTVDMQFGDGSTVTGIPSSIFTVLESE